MEPHMIEIYSLLFVFSIMWVSSVYNYYFNGLTEPTWLNINTYVFLQTIHVGFMVIG